MNQTSNVVVFDFDQKLPSGFRFPARMTLLPLGEDEVALVSPVPISDEMARRIAEHGEVRFLIAPNLLHYMYMADAQVRYPSAQVIAPRELAQKRPDLRIDHSLSASLPEALARSVDAIPIEGMPSLGEVALFHRTSRTLVLTDLVFNVVHPRGVIAHLVLALVGCHGKLATSRALRYGMTKDRARAAESARALLSLPIETLVMAHGDVVKHDAKAGLASALSWLPKSP